MNFIVLLILLGINNSFADKNVKSVISSDTIISNDIYIAPGETLFIQSGIKMLLEGYRSIVVKGTILVEGSSSCPVIFAPAQRSCLTEGNPCWKGIEMVGKSCMGRFRNCRFEGAFRNLIWGADTKFDTCEFAGNYFALYCTRNASVTIKSCKFYHNKYGICAQNSSPSLFGNSILNNENGICIMDNAKCATGSNIFKNNKIDILSDEENGDNRKASLISDIWKMMMQLF